MPQGFKPNIYPLIYWALLYGLSAGVLLFLVFLLSRFITIVWFPVFLAGLIWGGYRNYQRQKAEWSRAAGVAPQPQSPVEEFKEAARDIVEASRDLMQENGPSEPTVEPPPTPPEAPPTTPETPPEEQPGEGNTGAPRTPDSF